MDELKTSANQTMHFDAVWSRGKGKMRGSFLLSLVLLLSGRRLASNFCCNRLYPDYPCRTLGILPCHCTLGFQGGRKYQGRSLKQRGGTQDEQ